MNQLPTSYQWLTKEPGPKMLREALKLYGTLEKQGAGDNPIILAWAKELGIKEYNADEIPWCSLFMAYVAHKAGKPIPNNPLWARNWAEWGEKSKLPSLGDVLVFERSNGGGHVALYIGEDSGAYHILGGNQGDAVSITRIDKKRRIAVRRLYSTGVPPNVRPIYLSAHGRLSNNEA